VRIQALLTEAGGATWSDRLIGEATAGSVGPIEAEHYAVGVLRGRTNRPTPRWMRSMTSPLSKKLADDSVKLVLSDHDYDETARLTWYLGGRSASLSHLLPMLQSMGVGGTRKSDRSASPVPTACRCGSTQFQDRAATHDSAGRGRVPSGRRPPSAFADAVNRESGKAAIEIDRFNELVMRAGLNLAGRFVLLRSYAKYLRQAGFPYSQSHIESVINENPATARSLVTLFEALFDPDLSGSPRSRDAQAAAAAGGLGHRRIGEYGHRTASCVPFASLIQGHPTHQLLCEA